MGFRGGSKFDLNDTGGMIILVYVNLKPTIKFMNLFFPFGPSCPHKIDIEIFMASFR